MFDFTVANIVLTHGQYPVMPIEWIVSEGIRGWIHNVAVLETGSMTKDKLLCVYF